MIKSITAAMAIMFVMAMGVSTASATPVAMSLNDAGSSGQVLVFPYYNVNNGFVTSYNITNTTNEYKAVKIRFRESENSNDVLDFNLYLSPYDVFTLGLKPSRDGVLLETVDKSCTHPKIPAGGVEFRHGAYDSTDTSDVREGYLEIIEMGVVSANAAITNSFGQLQSVTTGGILHFNGIPVDCTVIETAWQQGVFTQGGAASNVALIDIVNPKSPGYPVQNVNSDLGFYGQDKPANIDAPTGGIVGTSILIDTASISGFVVEPISVNNYSTLGQHYLSSDENFYLLPSLASGNVTDVIRHIDGDVVNYSYVARDWGLDDTDVLPRISVPSGINPMPLADALLVTTVANQYFLGLGVQTDWVVSAPMRKHGIFNDYKYMDADPTLSVFPLGSIPVGRTSNSDDELTLAKTNGYWLKVTDMDVSSDFVYYDREESTHVPDAGDFSPPLQTETIEFPFTREVNILVLSGVNSEDSVLGSKHGRTLTLANGFQDGWGKFDFSEYSLVGGRFENWMTTDAKTALGVPVVGFMAARGSVNNGNVGETFPHIIERDVPVAIAP